MLLDSSAAIISVFFSVVVFIYLASEATLKLELQAVKVMPVWSLAKSGLKLYIFIKLKNSF
jgi:hypothetical protein